MSVESGSVTGILEAYTTDSLKAKLASLGALLQAVDSRSKQPIAIAPFANRASLNGKHFCLDCGRRLKTLVGKNHLQTRKNKGVSQ